MASFEDYDEFGNYIGADLNSDEEEEEIHAQQYQQESSHAAPLEGYDDEPMEEVGEGALMAVDGMCSRIPCCRFLSEACRAFA